MNFLKAYMVNYSPQLLKSIENLKEFLEIFVKPYCNELDMVEYSKMLNLLNSPYLVAYWLKNHVLTFRADNYQQLIKELIKNDDRSAPIDQKYLDVASKVLIKILNDMCDCLDII